ncbi:MAG: MBL fold metallo-hydrolase [Crenarchaeota archaeon]|nr:MBL fold metallo-hydrolase [Thermoproteota archaeon]
MFPLPLTDTESLKANGIEILKLDADPVSKRENYIKSYLAVGREGRVLFETGPAKSFETLIESLNSYGIKLSEVDAVFVTHIHLDHAGGLGKVLRECGCKAYVHPKGVKHLANPSKLNEAARAALGEEVFEAYGPAVPVEEEALVSTADGETINIKDVSVRVVHTPGHAPHHQAFLLNGVLFPGDALGEVTTWVGAYTPTTPHRTILNMVIDSIFKLMDLEPWASAYTHRGFVVGKENVLLQMAGSVEQLRTWRQTVWIRARECGADVWCHYERLKRADPMLKMLEEEVEKSSLLKNSIRMSIDGIYKYVMGIK